MKGPRTFGFVSSSSKFAFGVGAKCAVDLKHMFGPRWVYKLAPVFELLKLPVYPTGRHWNSDHREHDHVQRDLRDVKPPSQLDVWQAIGKRFAILGAQLK